MFVKFVIFFQIFFLDVDLCKKKMCRIIQYTILQTELQEKNFLLKCQPCLKIFAFTFAHRILEWSSLRSLYHQNDSFKLNHFNQLCHLTIFKMILYCFFLFCFVFQFEYTIDVLLLLEVAIAIYVYVDRDRVSLYSISLVFFYISWVQEFIDYFIKMKCLKV